MFSIQFYFIYLNKEIVVKNIYKFKVMKLSKLYPLMLLLMAVLLFSCSNNNPTFYEVVSGEEKNPDDGGTSGNGEGAQLILENLIIKGSVITKGTGVTTKLPKISNTFDFVVPKYGFLKNGFPIQFSRGSDIPLGVYIQIKTSEGKLSKGHIAFSIDSEIEPYNYVHFSDEIKAGDFCVVLYFLTTDGLTDPIEFCIEVPEWGGDNKVTGDWEIYYLYEISNGVKNIWYMDEYTYSSVEKDSYDCESGGTVVSYSNRSIIKESQFVLSESGEYHHLEDQFHEDLDYDETKKQCIAVWGGLSDFDFEEFRGNWFFDKKKSILYLVSFKERDDRNDDFELINYGELVYYRVLTEIKGLKLVVAYEQEDETYQYAFGIRTH
ncbi:MAG: hypothetical protein COB98_04020 [Flavobacteriaceae bacterium]|nr:MAG: hypothetical protein COB98_04020 [Flavobacteriaceae bacterium]